MNLIFIYGPPAVGKLTVAKELAKITDYKLFHNHVTIDMVESVFEYGTPVFIDMVDRYRLDLIEAAAREKIPGMIFTLVYVKQEDDAYVRKIIRVVQKHGGTVYFVHLTADTKALARRVRHASRTRFNKIRSVEKLNWILQNRPVHSSVPFKQNLIIDTERYAPKKAAAMIKKHYTL